MSRESLESILNALIPFAKVELERMGYVPPLAGSLDEAGDIELHMPRAGEPGSNDEFIELLRTALRHGAGSGAYRATGLLMEVRAERPTSDEEVDAIAVHLEAPDESLMAFLPYSKNEDGDVEYDELFFGPAEPDAFRRNGSVK
jgi:hypothetical protein